MSMATGGADREGVAEYENTLRAGCGLLNSCASREES